MRPPENEQMYVDVRELQGWEILKGIDSLHKEMLWRIF